jgi:peptide/nickel transport system ATP-binding protein
LAVARALAADPLLLILDESLTGLDLSVEAQIVNLLLDLQKRNRLTYIVVSHDLSVVWNIADRLLVLDGGEAAELSDAAALISRPAHARTRELVRAAASLTLGRSA